MHEPDPAIPFPFTGSPLSRLLVGYDGSAGAEAAAAFGLWLSGTVGSTTTLVHACPAQERPLPPDVVGAAAMALAQALAVALGATLVLLHAYDPHVPFVSEPTKAMRDALRRQGRAVVHDAHATVAAPLDVVVEEVVEGYARDELTAACERHAPALLVVGSRGLGGFRELLLGSTARWVANCAPCPVLVGRTPTSPQ